MQGREPGTAGAVKFRMEASKIEVRQVHYTSSLQNGLRNLLQITPKD